MVSSMKKVITFFLLIFLQSPGLCLNCYQCSSDTSENCKDPFDKKTKAVTTSNCESYEVNAFYQTYLQKLLPAPQTTDLPRYCVKIILDNAIGVTIMRTCVEGPSYNMNKTCSEFENNIQGPLALTQSIKTNLKHCSVCSGEKCNGAAGTAASLSLAAGAAVLAYLTCY